MNRGQWRRINSKKVKMALNAVFLIFVVAVVIGVITIMEGLQNGDLSKVVAMASAIYVLLGVLVGIFSKAIWELDIKLDNNKWAAICELLWPWFHFTGTTNCPPVHAMPYWAYVPIMGIYIGPKVIWCLVMYPTMAMIFGKPRSVR